ncbi:MAG: RNA-binding S4 domain-containing protein [Eubacterium sp.]|nr:RNA-binding S4 domain-containing protein [Eubacterium sp.]
MEEVVIRDDFIKLGQLLKLAGLVGSGVDAKMVIADEMVEVNGEICTQRGKKIYPGDEVSFQGEVVKVVK